MNICSNCENRKDGTCNTSVRGRTVCVALVSLVVCCALHTVTMLRLLQGDVAIRSIRVLDHSSWKAEAKRWDDSMLAENPPNGLHYQRHPTGVEGSNTDTSAPTPAINITVAMCHKSLYGPVNMTRVIHWASYYYDLGFDRIFIWYIPDVTTLPGFDQLERLPFVTLVPNLMGKPKQYKTSYQIDRESPGNQFDDIQQCLTETATGYSWVMMADSDEFLWFRQHVGVKEFLSLLDPSTSYCSFGKWMYTVRTAVETNRSLYDLNMNPFTAKSFCNGNRAEMASRRGSSFCPHHYGRAKLLIQPSKHKHELREVHIHGRKIPNATAGIVHFDTSEAHIKEWPGQFEPYSPTVRLPQDYIVLKDDASSVGIHSFEKAHSMNENATFTMYYDPDLEAWLDFVASRRHIE